MKKFIKPCLLLLALFTMSIALSGCSASSIMEAIKKALGKKPGTAQTPTPAPATPEPAPAPAPDSPNDNPNDNPNGDVKACNVTIYGSDACGRCTSAQKYLTSIGVAFVFKDIKKDSSANMEKSKKVQEFGGLPGNSIPIIDVCGDLIRGFDQSKLDELLKKHGLIGASGDPAAPATTTADVVNSCKVTVYGTSSCSWCKKAKDYLKSKGVPFADKDVGRDSAANQEMYKKAKAKGLTPRGVPVIDVCGDIILGFDQGKLDQLLQKNGFTGCSGGSCTTTENPGG